jgi:hypothetical protein
MVEQRGGQRREADPRRARKPLHEAVELAEQGSVEQARKSDRADADERGARHQTGWSIEAGGVLNHTGPRSVMWKQSSSLTPNRPGR